MPLAPSPSVSSILSARGQVETIDALRVLADEFLERALLAEARLTKQGDLVAVVAACRTALRESEAQLVRLHAAVDGHHATNLCDSGHLKRASDQSLPVLSLVRAALQAAGVN